MPVASLATEAGLTRWHGAEAQPCPLMFRCDRSTSAAPPCPPRVSLSRPFRWTPRAVTLVVRGVEPWQGGITSMTIIRDAQAQRKWLRSRLGDSTVTAEDDITITVAHHCIGIAGRNATGRSANYDTANDAGDAVKAAGKLHTTPPRPGGLRLWQDDEAGHIAFVDDDTDFVLCNVDDVIARIKASAYSNLEYLGWCWPHQVPGWGPLGPDAEPYVRPASSPGGAGAMNVVALPPPGPPAISISAVRKAYRAGFNGLGKRERTAEDVVDVYDALVKVGIHGGKRSRTVGVDRAGGKLAAYQRWQVGMGFTGHDANGVPGMASLSALCVEADYLMVD